MISFRFHVVSITAVFLAIAIGVVVGSTYIEGAVVDRLERQINTVEQSVDDARAENARLESELDQATAYVDLSSDFAVTERLTDVPVLLMATRGVDEASVERQVALARRAGALVPGVVWIEPRWAADGDEDLEALAAIVDGSPSDDPADLWAAAWEAVAEELTADEDSVPGDPLDDVTGGAGPPSSEVLSALEAEGFLTVDSLDDDSVSLTDLAGTGARVLMVTGARAEEEVAAVVPIAVGATAEAGLLTGVADIYIEAPEAPGRGAELSESLGESLLELIVIVDNADLEEGRVAAVLALDAAADGQVGLHYGYGDGADGVLPVWTAP